MACHAVHPARFRFDLENELFAPRTRLVHGDYALVPVNSSHRMHSDRPLSHYYADDNALDTRCALRPHHMIAADAALIDRDGPYSYSARCRNHPHICDDAEYFDLPDPNWRFSYKYPLQCMEPGGARWSPDQIYAYNRDVLRHNNQIARRRAAGVPGEYMMLYPIMDPLGRFPPGFDRPLPIQDFFGMDEHLIDTHRHHYNLPTPDTLERVLLLNSTEHTLRRQLKQIQLLELYGARRLAEQFAIQLLATQNALPGLLPPKTLGYGLGPEFDETYLSPLAREYGGIVPLEAIGYGNGLAEWNWNVLPQLMAARSSGAAWGGLSAGAMGSPWASRVGMVPGRAMGMGMNPGFGFQPSRWAAGMPHAAVAGAGGGPGPWPMPRSMSMSMGMGMGGPGNIHRVMDRISCDGGYGSRRGRFN